MPNFFVRYILEFISISANLIQGLSNFIVTGEGKIDHQSFGRKVNNGELPKDKAIKIILVFVAINEI